MCSRIHNRRLLSRFSEHAVRIAAQPFGIAAVVCKADLIGLRTLQGYTLRAAGRAAPPVPIGFFCDSIGADFQIPYCHRAVSFNRYFYPAFRQVSAGNNIDECLILIRNPAVLLDGEIGHGVVKLGVVRRGFIAHDGGFCRAVILGLARCQLIVSDPAWIHGFSAGFIFVPADELEAVRGGRDSALEHMRRRSPAHCHPGFRL